MQNLYLSTDEPTNIGRYLRQHKAKVIRVWGAGIALTLAYLALSARHYESEAKLLIRPGRENVALDPTAKTAGPVSSAENLEGQAYVVEELLRSRAIGEKIIDRFGPDAILERDTKKVGLLRTLLSPLNWLNLNPFRVYSVRDEALGALRRNLGVSTANKTNVVTVTYTATDPKLAQQILDALLEVARDGYLQAHRVKGSHEFFVDQSERLKNQLTTLEEQLRDKKTETGLSALTTQRELQLRLVDSLEADLVRARAEQNAADAEVAHRRQELDRTPALIVTARATGLPQTASQALREKLYDLEVREQEFAARMTDEHPQLVILRDQLAEARKIFKREDIPEQVTRGVNTTYQAAELAMQERKAAASSLSARTQSLEVAIAQAREKLTELNDSELIVRRLERELELVQSNYLKYAENLEEARINEALEDAKISSVNVMQPPTLSETPVRPQPMVTLMVGFVLSGLAGVGTAVGAEHRAKQKLTASATAANGNDLGGHPSLVSELARREAVLAGPIDPPKSNGNGAS